MSTEISFRFAPCADASHVEATTKHSIALGACSIEWTNPLKIESVATKFARSRQSVASSQFERFTSRNWKTHK